MTWRSGIITLTTDFGAAETYVGVVKGVILNIFSGATIVDLTHQIDPQDVPGATWALMDVVPYFSERTVHVAVVDPGVGSERRAIALFSGGQFFVGPDNGVFTPFFEEAESIVELNREEIFLENVSPTFHGRDIFAPVAANLAKGMKPPEIGDQITDPVTIRIPRAKAEGNTIKGEVVQIDRFGNVITNIPVKMLPRNAAVIVEVCDVKVDGLAACYSAIETEQVAALEGSSGRVEIAVREGSAAETLSASAGDEVVIRKM